MIPDEHDRLLPEQRARVRVDGMLAEAGWVVQDYKGRDVAAQGEAFDPAYENIEKRTERSKLPEGVQVAVLEKKTRGQLADVELTLSDPMPT